MLISIEMSRNLGSLVSRETKSWASEGLSILAEVWAILSSLFLAINIDALLQIYQPPGSFSQKQVSCLGVLLLMVHIYTGYRVVIREYVPVNATVINRSPVDE